LKRLYTGFVTAGSWEPTAVAKTVRANNSLAPSSSGQLRAHVEPAPAHPVRASDCAKRYHETAREPSSPGGNRQCGTCHRAKPRQRSTQPALAPRLRCSRRTAARRRCRNGGGAAGPQVCGTGPACAEVLATHPRVDMVSFTGARAGVARRSAGSAPVGRSDARAHTDAFLYCARLCGRDATDMHWVRSRDVHCDVRAVAP
jgi:hypothetical protein